MDAEVDSVLQLANGEKNYILPTVAGCNTKTLK